MNTTTTRPTHPRRPLLGQSSWPSRELTSGELRAAGLPRSWSVCVGIDHAGAVTLWHPVGRGFSRLSDDRIALAGLRAYWDGCSHAECAEARERYQRIGY